MKLITEEQVNTIDRVLRHFEYEGYSSGDIGEMLAEARSILSSLDTYEYTEERKQDFIVDEKCITYNED